MVLVSRLDSITTDATHLAAFESRDWVQLIFAGIVWGGSFIFIASGLDHFSPGVVTVARLTLGCLTLGLFRSARTVRIDRADWPRVVLVGITWLAFPMTLFPIAQQHISSGLAGCSTVRYRCSPRSSRRSACAASRDGGSWSVSPPGRSGSCCSDSLPSPTAARARSGSCWWCWRASATASPSRSTCRSPRSTARSRPSGGRRWSGCC